MGSLCSQVLYVHIFLSEIMVPYDHRYMVLLSELSDCHRFSTFLPRKKLGNGNELEVGEGRGELSWLETALNVKLVNLDPA